MPLSNIFSSHSSLLQRSKKKSIVETPFFLAPMPSLSVSHFRNACRIDEWCCASLWWTSLHTRSARSGETETAAEGCAALDGAMSFGAVQDMLYITSVHTPVHVHAHVDIFTSVHMSAHVSAHTSILMSLHTDVGCTVVGHESPDEPIEVDLRSCAAVRQQRIKHRLDQRLGHSDIETLERLKRLDDDGPRRWTCIWTCVWMCVCVTMNTDVCVDMCVDMCMDVCVDVCMDVYMDTCMGMCMDTCMDMCIGVHMDVCMDMRTDVCVDICMDVCMDMCMDANETQTNVPVLNITQHENMRRAVQNVRWCIPCQCIVHSHLAFCTARRMLACCVRAHFRSCVRAHPVPPIAHGMLHAVCNAAETALQPAPTSIEIATGCPELA